jgi:hypothetical protein
MNNKGKYLALCGVILQLGLPIGLIGTLVGMMRTFNDISANRPVDQNAIAAYIGAAMIATSIAMTLAIVGFILSLIAFFKVKYRARWFYTSLWAFCVLWLLLYPVGTILGIVMAYYLYTHKQEFEAKAKSEPAV